MVCADKVNLDYVEQLAKVKDWFFTRMTQEKKVAYGKPSRKEIDRDALWETIKKTMGNFNDWWMVVKSSPY